MTYEFAVPCFKGPHAFGQGNAAKKIGKLSQTLHMTDDPAERDFYDQLTKASRIPFFVERASNGAIMSVKLASVDEQDLGVSELKRTVAQLLDVPERCRQKKSVPFHTANLYPYKNYR